jgi:hypothetical protein
MVIIEGNSFGGPVNKRFLFLVSFFCMVFALSCRSADPAKRYPNMIADADPISLGTVEVEFDKAFSSELTKKEVDVIFYPRYNEVALEFRYEGVRYRQYWSEAGRRLFTAALNRYKADYEAKNLGAKFSKSRAIYGKIKGRTEWEVVSFASTGIAYPNMELGYRFRGRGGGSPYFLVLQRSAANENVANTDDNRPDSLQIAIYYTRAQGDVLAKIFDQSYLLSFLGPAAAPDAALPARDEYQELD